MLQLFKTNQFSIGILLLLYAAVLKTGVFINPLDHDSTTHITGYLFERIQPWMPTRPLAQSLLGISLIFIGGFITSVITVKQRLEIEVTLFSGLFFILVAAFVYNYTQASGLEIGAIFLLLALQNILSSPNKVYNSIFLFNAGFFIGIASLFYWSLWIFLIWAILTVFQLLGAKFKETMMVVTGFVVPFFYQGVDYFRQQHFSDFWNDLGLRYFNVSTLPSMDSNLNRWIGGGILVFLLLSILIGHQQNIKKKQVIIRRKINSIYWMIPFAIIAVIIQSNGQFSDFFLLTIPVSIMMAFQFVRYKPNTREFLHLILFVLAIYLSFSFL